MGAVHIIGGGIGGLMLAKALHRAGIDFHLYEQAPQLTEVGAAIGISKAVLDILEMLGLDRQVKNSGSVTQHVRFEDKNLNVIRAVTAKWPGVIIHRAKLIDILASGLPKEKIHLNKKFIRVTSEPDFSILRFSDGFEIKSDCTVMADGIQSLARNQLFPEIKIRSAGQTIWRGITTIQLPEQYSNTFTEIWDDSKRFLFAPMDSNTVCWLAIKNGTFVAQESPDTIRQELLNSYNHFHPLLKELLLKSSNFIRNELTDLGTEKLNWYHNKIVFIGDAIHATTPNLAQGGCQAMEDAFCLAHLMKNSTGDFSNLFPLYQNLRNKKVSYIIKTSWRFGKMMDSPLRTFIMNCFFKYAPNSFFVRLERRLNDLSYLSDVTQKQ